MDCEIIRKKGIDGFVSGYSPGKVEEEASAIVRNKIDLNDLANRLNQAPRTWPIEKDFLIDDEVLTPKEIRILTSVLMAYGPPEYTGEYINNLIMNSYNDGHNNFRLDLQFAPDLKYVLYNHDHRIMGTENNPIIVEINGDLSGSYMLFALRYANVTINGNPACAGEVGRDISVIVNGNVSYHLGSSCLDSNFFVSGSVGGSRGDASANCTFRTSSKSTLKKFLQPYCKWGVPLEYDSKPNGNKIIFVHPDGREELMAGQDRYSEK